MALNPELIKRRKRVDTPRAPFRSLGEPVKGLNTADEDLKALLEQILAESKSGTLFTLTLERDRLFSALYYAGFVLPVWASVEVALAPLGLTTVYLAVPPGTVLVPREISSYSSLPWFLSLSFWVDSEPPALPMCATLRHPDNYNLSFGGIVPVKRFVRFTLFNNHLVNPVNYGCFVEVAFMAESAWKMLETIYLKPIAEYAQEKAEALTGRPFP